MGVPYLGYVACLKQPCFLLVINFLPCMLFGTHTHTHIHTYTYTHNTRTQHTVPFLSRLLPSDVCKIYKTGSCVRFVPSSEESARKRRRERLRERGDERREERRERGGGREEEGREEGEGRREERRRERGGGKRRV